MLLLSGAGREVRGTCWRRGLVGHHCFRCLSAWSNRNNEIFLLILIRTFFTNFGSHSYECRMGTMFAALPFLQKHHQVFTVAATFLRKAVRLLPLFIFSLDWSYVHPCIRSSFHLSWFLNVGLIGLWRQQWTRWQQILRFRCCWRAYLLREKPTIMWRFICFSFFFFFQFSMVLLKSLQYTIHTRSKFAPVEL